MQDPQTEAMEGEQTNRIAGLGCIRLNLRVE
jgi:hypothetical protein